MATKWVIFRKCGSLVVADPGELRVRAGDTVRFAERPGMRLFFPEVELVNGGERGRGKSLVVALYKGFNFKVPRLPRMLLPRTFFYAVYESPTRTFATGGSNPKIIVEP